MNGEAIKRLPGNAPAPLPMADSVLPAVTGWLLMILALSQLILRTQTFYHPEFATAATVSALIITAFVYLLRPSLGAWFEARSAISGIVIFATGAIGLTHVLGNQNTGWLSTAYGAMREQIETWVTLLLGEDLASFITSPLYLICAFVLIAAFAYRSFAVFVGFVVCLLVYGAVPFSLPILTAYLLWFAGFLLVTREALFLPARIERHVRLSPAQRDLLLELRERPLYRGEACLFLTGANMSDDSNDAALGGALQPLADSGLVEYNPTTGRLHPGTAIQYSHAPHWVGVLSNALATLSALVLFLCGLGYFISPIDFMPDVVPGVGFADDVVFLLLSSLPLGTNLFGLVQGRVRQARLPHPPK